MEFHKSKYKNFDTFKILLCSALGKNIKFYLWDKKMVVPKLRFLEAFKGMDS